MSESKGSDRTAHPVGTGTELIDTPLTALSQTEQQTIASEGSEAISLIIHADDFGMCHAANSATMELLDGGYITSASIMPVCPWFQEAAGFAAGRTDLDIGVHLTFTSEWSDYRWAGISGSTNAPSLHDRSGWFFRDCRSFQLAAAETEIAQEIDLQISRMHDAGVDITHIDNHMGSLYGLETGRSWLPLVFQRCSDLQVPFRLPKVFEDNGIRRLDDTLKRALRDLADIAGGMGIPLIDKLIEYPFHVQQGETYETFREMVAGLLSELRPGVSELYIHPSVDTEEIRVINPSWTKRVWEYEVFKDPEIRSLIRDLRIDLISWRDLKRMREGRSITEGRS